jgi:putative endonuclease
MKISRIKLGKLGEEKALNYLLHKNYKLIVQNYSSSLGEIDLIALNGKYIVFIEVKTRSTDNFGPPQLAVNYRKQQKIREIAQFFLLNNNYSKYQIRFDVIAVSLIKDNTHIEHFINAF